ncbi:hypothetical protein ACFX13_017023 [Malus domestica]
MVQTYIISGWCKTRVRALNLEYPPAQKATGPGRIRQVVGYVKPEQVTSGFAPASKANVSITSATLFNFFCVWCVQFMRRRECEPTRAATIALEHPNASLT